MALEINCKGVCKHKMCLNDVALIAYSLNDRTLQKTIGNFSLWKILKKNILKPVGMRRPVHFQD